MVLAVIVGIIVGIVGFMPLILGLRAAKRVTSTSNFSHMSILLLCLIASFAILLGGALTCWKLAGDVVLYFVLAEALALVCTTLVFAVSTRTKPKASDNEEMERKG